MIEHAKKEHDVELSEPVGGEIGDVDVEFFDLEIERGSRQVKGGPAVDFRPPAEVIRRQDARGTPPLGLEAEVAIPGADIQDRLAWKVQGAEDRVCFGTEYIQRLAARSDDPIPEVDGMKPVVGLDPREQLRGGSVERLLVARLLLPSGGAVTDLSPSEKPLHVGLQVCHRLALSTLEDMFTSGCFRMSETRRQYT